VGIDLHRRSVIAGTTAAGEVLETVHVVIEADQLGEVIALAGPDAEVVPESTYSWYWALGALQAAGASMHLRTIRWGSWLSRYHLNC
jgi:hypothetical protein